MRSQDGFKVIICYPSSNEANSCDGKKNTIKPDGCFLNNFVCYVAKKKFPNSARSQWLIRSHATSKNKNCFVRG